MKKHFLVLVFLPIVLYSQNISDLASGPLKGASFTPGKMSFFLSNTLSAGFASSLINDEKEIRSFYDVYNRKADPIETIFTNTFSPGGQNITRYQQFFLDINKIIGF